MVSTRNREIFWFCLTLALAISLVSVGGVILYDFYIGGAETPGRISLSPGGGILAILISCSFLALLFQLPKLATGIGLLVLVTAAAFAAVPILPLGAGFQILAIKPALLLAIAFIVLSALAAIHLSRGWVVGRIAFPVVFTTGLLSLLSHWYPALEMAGVGSIAESTIVVSPLLILISLTLPFLYRIYHRDIPVYSLSLILVGVLGILITTISWHIIRLQYSENLTGRAEALASQLAASEKVLLATTTGEAQQRSEWRMDVYMPRGSLPSAYLYLPPLILFTGLGLSFLVMLTHLFWRESERRSGVLGELNDVLNFHLEEERGLRHINEKIMEFSRDILCSISPSGRFLTVSPASEVVLGYAPGELKGQPYDILLLPEDRGSTAEEVRKLATGQNAKTSSFRNRLRHKNGHTVTVSWTAEWSRDDNALFCVGRDISGELVAETLTRERDQFFSLSPDMFCIVDLNSHFFEVNNTFVEALSYTRDQLLGSSYMGLIHSEDQHKVVEAVQTLTGGGKVQNLFIRALDTAGNKHWLQINAILSDDDLIYVVARDITEALETQERLKQSEALLRIAEKTALIGGWTVEVPSGETAWTSVIFDIFELPSREVPDLEVGLSYYTDESRKILTDAIELCSKTGIPFDEEVQFRTANGRLRWARAIGHAVKNETGEIIRLQGGFQDITASRQAMEQIKRFAERQAIIFESITDAFFTVDRKWRFTYVNRRSEELLRRSRDELLGHSLWEIFPAAIGTEFDEMYRHAMTTGESVSFEAHYAPLDNWLEVSAYPSDEGLAVYYRSIRERREAQWKLEATMEELERSNKELQDFAFVASHDLQEPLRKIQAFSDRLLVKSHQFGPEEKDYLNRMQSAAARMQSLIRDLLSYSRLTTRAKPLETCDTQSIVLNVLQDMETSITAEKANIDLTPLPPVKGDATQLRQVFQNLISNAIKFHDPGQTPTIMIYPEDITPGSWTLVVSDNGIGFDLKYAEKIFHPFQRLHKRDTFAGTGIGMAIVKKILDRHGADIRTESAPGEGTTFRIRFRNEEPNSEAKHGQS